MLVGRGVADARPARHLPQRELPALVVAQHRLRGLNDDPLQVAVMVGAGGIFLHFTGLAIS